MSTIDENWNVVDVTRAFCQKVLPLVYDESLSYMEMVCKMSSKLNEVIENNNNLPHYVKDLIKETVNSDKFVQIVGSVLMNTIINVKFPPEGITPAKGDGVTDDTKSIQDCLDYANAQGGATVFFPSGKYLTSTLSINQKTSILGTDRYNTTIYLKGGGNTPLLQGVINQSVRNISLDGNRLNQIEENYLIDGDIENALIDNVILCDSSHCITSEKFNDNEFNNVKVVDIGDSIFIDAIGNNNLLTNINTEYDIIITGDNNNWQSQQETNISGTELNVTTTDTKFLGKNPITYQTPQKLNEYFNYVTMQDNEKIYKLLVEGEKEVESKIYDKPEDYGAIGDGIHDDTQAFIELFNSNKQHYFNKNANYLISPANIPINNSIDFNNCTIILNNINNEDVFFTIEIEGETLTINETNITNLGVSDSNLFGKSFFLKSPINIGKSIITGNPFYHSQLLVTDENGNFINTKYYPQVIAGSYTCSNIQNAIVENITLKNVNIVYKNKDKKNRLLHITRNNVYLENFNVTGEIRTNEINDIIVFANNYNVRVKNLIGNSMNRENAGYLLALYNVSNIEIDGLISNNINTWHEIGGSNLSNIAIKNSIIMAYDSHYENFGYIEIIDTSLKSLQIGNGYFNMFVNNCNFMTNEPTMFFRHDTPLFHSGNITIKNCFCENSKEFQMHSQIDNTFNTIPLGNLISKIFIENCKFKQYGVSVSNVLDFQDIKFELKDCEIGVVSINANKQNFDAILDNVITTASGTYYGAYCNNLQLKNLNLDVAIGVRNTKTLQINNSKFVSLYLPTKDQEFVGIHDSIFTTDFNLTSSLSEIPIYSLTGNTINAETKNNLENVNGVK